MTEHELAWLAGFIDGEGSLGIERRRHVLKGGRIVHRFMPKMSVTNTHLPTIKKVARMTNGSRSGWPIGRRQAVMVTKPAKRALKKYKQCYCVQWSAERARIVMREVLPYLVTKRAQAKTVLSMPKGRRGGGRGYIPQLNARTLARQEELYWRCRELNTGRRYPRA